MEQNDIKAFLRRGQAAQEAVNKVVGETPSMMLHIYTARVQPFTRYTVDDPVGRKNLVIKNDPRSRATCEVCWKTRMAKNLSIQVYYDKSYIFCTVKCIPITYKEKRALWRRMERTKK